MSQVGIYAQNWLPDIYSPETSVCNISWTPKLRVDIVTGTVQLTLCKQELKLKN